MYTCRLHQNMDNDCYHHRFKGRPFPLAECGKGDDQFVQASMLHCKTPSLKYQYIPAFLSGQLNNLQLIIYMFKHLTGVKVAGSNVVVSL